MNVFRLRQAINELSEIKLSERVLRIKKQKKKADNSHYQPYKNHLSKGASLLACSAACVPA